MAIQTQSKKLDGKVVVEFILSAIDVETDGTNYRGIHAVYSGLNAALDEKFGMDSEARIQFYRWAEQKQLLTVRPTKGGVIVYPFGQAPVSNGNKAKANKLIAAVAAKGGK